MQLLISTRSTRKKLFRKGSICSVDSACIQMEELTLCGKCATCTLVKPNTMHKSSLPQFDPIAVSQHMFHCTWMCLSFCCDTQTNFTMNSIRQHTDPHDNFSAMFTRQLCIDKKLRVRMFFNVFTHCAAHSHEHEFRILSAAHFIS